VGVLDPENRDLEPKKNPQWVLIMRLGLVKDLRVVGGKG